MSTIDFSGSWFGRNKLWFESPIPEESASSITIDGNRLAYTWRFRGEPQHGMLLFKPAAPTVTGEWIDSWHSPTPMSMIGTIKPGQMSMLGHYAAGEELWGWRIELELDDSRQILLRMYNIDPQQRESLAVELVSIGTS